MKSIFASKLYRASSRKERIQAAILAPGNFSLVQQLADSLDEEYKTRSNLGIEEEPASDSDASGADFIVDEDIDPSKDLVTMDDLDVGKSSSKSSGGSKKSSRSHSSSMPLGPKPKLGPDSDKMPDSPATDVSDEEPEAPKEEPEEAAASTKVTSCTEVDLTVIKDSLNNREDTHGVARVAEKENEIWIYYKDEINLNNVMTEVIEYLLNAGFRSLEFNRLARSDNAIVFVKVESVGEVPIAAATVGAVPPGVKVNNDTTPAAQEAEPADTEFSEALEWIKKQKDFDSEVKIKSFSRNGNTIIVEFDNDSSLTFDEGHIKDKTYQQAIEEEMHGESSFQAATGESFDAVLKEKLDH